jgi:hypothetical protein
MKRKTIFFSIGVITTLLMLVSGCIGNNPTAGNLDTSGVSLGRLVVKITDAPNVALDRVMLTITGLQVHKAGPGDEQEQEQNNGETQNQEANQNQNEDNGGWINLDLVGATDGKLTFNLLDYQDELQKMAAVADLEPGKYTQIRMEVDSVELDLAGGDTTTIPATLPSGSLKFIQPFDLVAGQTTELLFDIDAMKSVHQNGNETYIFKPVIKLEVVSQPIAEPLVIIPESLPNGVVGTTYSATLGAPAAVGAVTWSLESGSLPAGLTFTDGVISGIPTLSGSYTFTVKVTDSGTFPKNTATASYTVNITGLQITTTSPLPDGVQGASYGPVTLQAVGGIGTLTWSIVAPTVLPDGLSLSPDGVISGTLSATAATSDFTVQVTDGSSPAQIVTGNFSITVTAP